MKRLSLIYFEGCPNAHRIIKLLKRLNLEYSLIDQEDLPVADPNRNYSSPTLILGNEVLFGSKTQSGMRSCSFEVLDETLLEKKLKAVIAKEHD